MSDVILNELSLPRPDDDFSDADISRLLKQFIDVLRKLATMRSDLGLLIPLSLEETTVNSAGDNLYTVSSRLGGASRDHMRLLQSKGNKASCYDISQDSEYKYNDSTCIGFGIAESTQQLALSFSTSSDWQRKSIDILRLSLGSESNDQIIETCHEVNNSATAGDLDIFYDFILNMGLPKDYSGEDLWNLCQSFPHLQLLPRVRTQLKGLDSGSAALSAVTQRMIELEIAVANWIGSGNAEPDWRSTITPESESRIKEGRCTFLDNGVLHIFSYHARYTPGAGRIHFRLVKEIDQHYLRVAHVGRKL